RRAGDKSPRFKQAKKRFLPSSHTCQLILASLFAVCSSLAKDFSQMSAFGGAQLSCDVAIVGAGLSGLSAAQRLLQARPDLRVLVLEAAGDRVGGRTLTKPVRCADGESRGWCFGGSHMAKSHSRMLQLAKDFGLTVSEQPESAGKNILEIGDTIDRYEGETPNLGTLTLLDLDKGIKSLDKLSKTLMENRASWTNLDGMTLSKKIEKETWRQATRQCLTAIAEPCFDGEPDRISCLQALRIANSAGGFLALLSDGSELRIEEGAQAVCTALAERIGSDRVLLGRELMQVSATEDEVRLTVRSGEEVTASYAVLTPPLAVLSRIRFSPELPAPKRGLIEAAGSFAASPGWMTSAVTAVLTYPTAFWRSQGCSGDILSHLGSPVPGSAMPVAPIALAGEVTSPDGRQPALMVATGYTAEHSWPNAEARRADILSHLARFFPRPEVDGYVDYVEHDWGAGPTGASPLPPGAGVGLCDLTALLQPAGRLHFAGADFATEWIGTMEGAVQSGQRAADEVLRRLAA
ncbi:hypothetical protein BOX15_Mlig012596g3, partial [Macrostomum lignano]